MNKITLNEIIAIFQKMLIWTTLGYQDIKLRYHRSSLGPFWITLSTAVTIYSLGFLYGHLFKVNLAHYFPYLASGIIGWNLLSTLLTESTLAFIEAENYIKNLESYFSVFIMRVILRNLIVFAHNLVAFMPIFFIFHLHFGLKLCLLLPGLIIFSLNGVFWGTMLAIIGTRYRDFPQIIASLIQVIFFLTPIMWLSTLLPKQYQWAVLYNPFNQFLNLIRNPLINQGITINNMMIVTGVTLLGGALYSLMIKKYKYKIVFWL